LILEFVAQIGHHDEILVGINGGFDFPSTPSIASAFSLNIRGAKTRLWAQMAKKAPKQPPWEAPSVEESKIYRNSK
jgi:hypothetical protein